MEEKIINIISEHFGISKDQLTPESYFIADLGLTSFDFISLVNKVEDEFDIEIDERDWQSMKQVKDVIGYCNRL